MVFHDETHIQTEINFNGWLSCYNNNMNSNQKKKNTHHFGVAFRFNCTAHSNNKNLSFSLREKFINWNLSCCTPNQPFFTFSHCFIIFIEFVVFSVHTIQIFGSCPTKRYNEMNIHKHLERFFFSVVHSTNSQTNYLAEYYWMNFSRNGFLIFITNV